jgi:hypothetical protein
VASTSDAVEPVDGSEHDLLLLAPGWQPESPDEPPPIEAIVGLWPVTDGKAGRFRPNPGYLPADDKSPSDPLDAVLLLTLRGEATKDQIRHMLASTLIDVAMNGDGRPLIMRSPDDIPCLLLASAEVHKRRIFAPDWLLADVGEIVELLPEDTDVLINMGGIASVRLTGDFIREAAGDATMDEIEEFVRSAGFGVTDYVLDDDDEDEDEDEEDAPSVESGQK